MESYVKLVLSIIFGGLIAVVFARWYYTLTLWVTGSQDITAWVMAVTAIICIFACAHKSINR